MPISYPIALKLEGRRCLVIGSGTEALERAGALERSGASVLLLAPAASAEFVGRLPHGVEMQAREVEDEDLDGVWLVVLSERNELFAERLRVATESRRIFFCAVDQPSFSSFSFLAIARAGLTFAAVGTEGEAPALARRLREILEQLFERSALGAFTEKLAKLRRATPSDRRREVLGAAVAPVRLEGELRLPELEREQD